MAVEGRHRALAVVRVQPQLPILEADDGARRQAEYRVHLRRVKDRHPILIDDVGDGRDLLDQCSEPLLGLGQVAGSSSGQS